MLALLAAAAIAAGGYGDGDTLCRLSDPQITESSGIAASATYDDLFYTHNDSGDDARIFAIDRSCRTVATFALSGVDTRDWEDISRGPGRTLWLADIGDNSERRDRGILVHRVVEPKRSTGVVRLASTSYRLTYPDGPHDAEALLVHPRTGQLIIVTKGLGHGVAYALSQPLRADVPNRLCRVADVALPLVTAGDISPDGSRVVLRNYSAAYEWDVRGDDVIGAMRGRPARIALPPSEQGEGITYSRDGQGLIVSSEGVGSPVHELRRTATPSASPSPSAAASAQPSRASPPQPARWRPLVIPVIAAVVLALGLVGLRRTRIVRSR